MNKHHQREPVVGNWYASKRTPESFMIVDYDPDDVIEIQYLDGELDKIEYEAWGELNAQEIPEPEDERAPYGIEHEHDVRSMLTDIEDQEDLEHYGHNPDSDETEWN